MTCIVAISDGDTVILGGDSAGTGGFDLRLRADRKVFRAGRYAIGFTTSFRMGQIRPDYHLARPLVPYSAVGFGSNIALGALHALSHVSGHSLEEKAGKALQAAEAYSTVVRGPFHFVETSPRGPRPC